MKRLAPLALLATTSCCGLCKPNPQAELNRVSQQNSALRFQVDAAEQANKAAREYLGELSGGGDKAPAELVLYFAATDIVSQSAKILPYRIPAHDFNDQLAGDIVVQSVSDVTFWAGNRLHCRLHMRGEGVRYTGQVPNMYKAEVQRFTEGVAAGVIADLDVTLTSTANNLKALSVCTEAHLLRNDSATYDSQLKDQLNQRALQTPLYFDMSIAGLPARLTRVLVTGNHVVVGYAP